MDDVKSLQDIKDLRIMIENTFIYQSENNLATKWVDSKTFRKTIKKNMMNIKKPKGFLGGEIIEDVECYF